MGLFSKIGMGLKKTRDSIAANMNAVLSSFTHIDEDLIGELEEALIMADTGAVTAARVCDMLREEIRRTGATDPAQLKSMLRAIVAKLLTGDHALKIGTKPSVILVIGVNGAGKTTAIGKLAAQLKSEGRSVILGAADTFRAAAIDQLAVWAQRAGAELIRHTEGSDPAAVVFDTIAAGKARGRDVIIIDTAGRLHNKKNLMDELAKISRVIRRELPECDIETLLVLDGTTGQNALSQARQFKETAGISGIVLTKLDGTAKGGVVVGIVEELKIPVKFIGVGEGIDDLRPFDAEEFAAALFDAEEEG
ncbi:MAG: signal recognition particle-docking protein FtsY [Oscillospiraceae bacterium]|nr:signal recognition particle-docking protein FtsY [Oscillospiraceae bacterium]